MLASFTVILLKSNVDSRYRRDDFICCSKIAVLLMFFKEAKAAVLTMNLVNNINFVFGLLHLWSIKFHIVNGYLEANSKTLKSIGRHRVDYYAPACFPLDQPVV
jgi:hypothetical protein